jgi:hypothetical protein
VFGPNQAYDITGWRKSNAEVAAFEFTAAPNSYAARTGRPANVGVIGVALFRERLPEPPPAALVAPPVRESLGGAAKAASANATGAAAADALEGRLQRLPEPGLGTGHGQREASYVEHTDFTRRGSTPDEIIRIRYDSRDNLVALGVIRRPPVLPPAPNPFPDSPGEQFVPDPPGYRQGGLR